MNRVAVLGCGGSGKTTLARRLALKRELPIVHTDNYRPGWEEAQPTLIQGERWVIDAMRLGTLDERLVRADTAIFLDLPVRTCVRSIVMRRLRQRGRVADDGGTGYLNRAMWGWVLGFRRRHRSRVLELLAQHAGDTEVIVLRSRREVDAFLESA
jgi:adenylate kinase family enzyme